jgi:hypothetical protein
MNCVAHLPETLVTTYITTLLYLYSVLVVLKEFETFSYCYYYYYYYNYYYYYYYITN